MSSVLTKPKLTFPEAEAAWVREHYETARVILEYGSGGSTVLAGEQLGAHVFSVESDLDWAADLSKWFDENPPLANVQLHPVNIGKTGKWGMPVSDAGWRKYHNYPLSVWDREDFQHPDVVLVDGRFRAACWMACAFRATKPLVILFDDYVDRDHYHVVERYAKPTEIRGRMARFEITPRIFPVEDLGLIFDTFARQK